VTDRQDTAITLPWMRQGTELLVARVGQLSDDQLREPSALPGWTRAHVVAHLARNAEALGRLAHWAATGTETPMYPDLGARAAGIERSAGNPAPVLRAELRSTAAELEHRFDGFDQAAWSATVRYATGEPIPGHELPWARIREVWLHGVDLGAGIRTGDFPADLVDGLLDDFVGRLDAKPDCPPVVLSPSDRSQTWTLGPAGEPAQVRGAAAEVLAWVCGRAHDLTGPLPELPAWI
jgi:maleylpyruvate isomerase